MTIVTVDLDDTLLETSIDYMHSKAQFGQYMQSQFNIESQEAIETLEQKDKLLVQEEGLTIERYPKAFRYAVDELVQNATTEIKSHVETLGYQTYKSVSEYQERGFMNGAEEMITHLQNADELHLVTVGDPAAQLPKIEALNLRNWFNDIHIASLDEGKSGTFNDILSNTTHTNENFVHIGNSASSDVEATLSIGGTAVYISETTDWLSDESQHEKYIDHQHVYAYNSAQEFLPDIQPLLDDHQPTNATNI